MNLKLLVEYCTVPKININIFVCVDSTQLNMAERPSRQRNPTIKLTDKNQSLPPILSSHHENLASHASRRQEEELANASITLSINDNVIDADTPTNPANKRASPNESDPGASLLPGAASKKTGNQKKGGNCSRQSDGADLLPFMLFLISD